MRKLMITSLLLVSVMGVMGCAHPQHPITPQPLRADFDWHLVDTTTSVRFVNTTTGGPFEKEYYFWDFGDGSLSQDRHPINEYSTCGTYQVKLRVCPEPVYDMSCSLAENQINIPTEICLLG